MSMLAKYGIRANEFPGLTRKIVCIGRNYADHIAELGNATPKAPFFFLKPSTSIVPSGASVLIPRGETVHYEVELGLVMGKMVRDLSPTASRSEVLSAIAGYTVAIDMTSRSAQDVAKKAGLPWSMAKGADTYCPLSGFIPRDRIPDPDAAELYLSVNGQVRQQDPTSLMIFKIPQILARISSIMTLEEHDIVLTGTPKGVGPVVPGDSMHAGIRVNGSIVQEGELLVDVKER